MLILRSIIGPDEPRFTAPEWALDDVELGGAAWDIRIFWNDRVERWQIDIEERGGLRGVRGLRMVPQYPIGSSHTGQMPDGVVLALIDFADPDAREQCTYEGLGWRWKVCVFEDDGIVSMRPRNWAASLS